MEDLKIRVANEAESKEAQELFFKLDYYWAFRNLGKNFNFDKGDVYLFAESNGILRAGIKENESFFNDWRGKEITLQELKDMVVMKESLNDKVASAEEFRQGLADLPEFKHDVVNHPSHYTSGDIECIDAIKASMSKEAFAGFLKGNIIKYMWRYEHKNGIEDLKKAQWYQNKLIELLR